MRRARRPGQWPRIHAEAATQGTRPPVVHHSLGSSPHRKCSARADKAPYRAEGENGLNDGEKAKKMLGGGERRTGTRMTSGDSRATEAAKESHPQAARGVPVRSANLSSPGGEGAQSPDAPARLPTILRIKEIRTDEGARPSPWYPTYELARKEMYVKACSRAQAPRLQERHERANGYLRGAKTKPRRRPGQRRRRNVGLANAAVSGQLLPARVL